MNWLSYLILIVVVWLCLTGAFFYGTSQDVWNAGNSCYIPEIK